MPLAGEIDYSSVVKLDLGAVTPSLSGPKRPQDRIEIGKVASTFTSLFSKPIQENGFNQAPQLLLTRHLVQRPNVEEDPIRQPESPPAPVAAPRFEEEMEANKPTLRASGALSVTNVEVGDVTIGNGDVLIAAITSCTNTSNPSVMLAAGLLAKKAVEKGLRVAPHIKTSLAPGSRMVTEYLRDAKLLPYLEQLGFTLAGYGCTTCIGQLRRPHAARSMRRSARATSCARRCFRAIATSRRASIRTSRPTFLPARRWWWPMPSPAAC